MERGPENPELDSLVKVLGKSKSKAWKRVAQLLASPRRRRPEVNLHAIEKYAEAGDVVVVPGKVLSQGTLSNKVTIACFSSSAGAAAKARAAGSKLVSIESVFKENATGKKIKIIV